MPGATKGIPCDKLHQEDDERTLQSMRQELKTQIKSKSSSAKRKITNCLHKCNGSVSSKKKMADKASEKKKKILKKAIEHKNKSSKKLKKAIEHKNKSSKKQPSSLSGNKNKSRGVVRKGNERADDEDIKPQKLKRRKKKSKNNGELDEASRLQRRTRYLLVKMKLEQNLIDAYSTEGWKGQSREKLKPEKELQRAKKQILKCKLGLREAIHQLDLLGSEGQSYDATIASDGSLHHEHIICAKCKLREALPDNDIILCDGTCNCAFHQRCLDPPLLTENIPPNDEGWFCKFCKKKVEILEAMNAHLGTHFPMDVCWQEVFKEEAALPDDGNLMVCQEEEWPSDDSEDDDYDPDRIEHSGSGSGSCGISRTGSEASDDNSSDIVSLEDEALLALGRYEDGSHRSPENSLDRIGVDSDYINEGEVVSGPRQRVAVDYIKLYDEMFGKNAPENEEISDDEDWGPTRRRRKVKENDAASTSLTLGETDRRNSEETPSELKAKQLIQKIKRPIFRLPHNAVEKLRLVFAENELPARTIRVSLSEQLGLEVEKVNKWFKNARYLALKARKQAEGALASQNVNPTDQKEPIPETANDDSDQMSSRSNTASQNPTSIKKFVRRKNTHLLTKSVKGKQRRKPFLEKANSHQATMDPGDDVSLKYLKEKAKEAKKKLNDSNRDVLEAEAEMERLCQIKGRLERLQQVLLQLPIRRLDKGKSSKDGAINSRDSSIILVPVAELREKR